MAEFIAGLALGLLIGAAIIGLWAVVGFVVAVTRYIVTPPPPAAGPCATCTRLQALWNSMPIWEKGAALANFVAASVICAATGCGFLALTF
jgi:hypothetical protein